MTTHVLPVLRINSLDDLFGHEKEILRRIDETPSGPNLFVIHPLRMLADIGVELSDEARRALLRHEPGLAKLSVAYTLFRKVFIFPLRAESLESSILPGLGPKALENQSGLGHLEVCGILRDEHRLATEEKGEPA